MNIFLEKLTKIYSKSKLTSIKEIKIIIFVIKKALMKEAPGPHGFIIKLYQTFKEVTNSVKKRMELFPTHFIKPTLP